MILIKGRASFVLSVSFLWFANVAFGISASSATDLSGQAILFDAGTKERLSPHARVLSPVTLYNKDTGYGWVSRDTKVALERHNLMRSRDELTIDSVTAARLKFRVDLTPGLWQMTFWMEAGIEDKSSLSFFVQGEKQSLNWFAFNVPAEPRTDIKPGYRLYTNTVTVGDDGLVLEWIGDKDIVRLNGVQFIPKQQTPKSLQKIKQRKTQLALRIKNAGRYNSTLPLETIIDDIDQNITKNSNDFYAQHWRHQLDILASAENYFEGLRGWEWARKKTGLSMFGRYEQAIMLLDGLLANSADSHPLYERALYQRGRLLYWLDREGHGNNYAGIAPPDLKALYSRHPDDNILAMYANEKIDTPDACDKIQPPVNAPDWSVAQNEVLCRTRLVSHWWINSRQDSNGELGGKYGDDVEMLRWWTIPFLAGDSITSKGWKKLATGVWHSDRLEEGYYKKASDVEHASEPISDTAPLLTYLNEEAYTNRLGFSVRHFLDRWTVVNSKGRRYFRSAWFGALTIDERPPRNRDIPMNGRAAKAVRYYAWQTKEAKTVNALHEWAQAWAHAAMRTDKGKPAGIIPASIRASDEAINGDEPTWYEANMFWSYFNWNHEAGQQIYDLLLFTSELTGDEKLLEPLFAAADLVATYIKAPQPKTAAKIGSLRWAVKRLRNEPAFWSVLEQWRLLSGNTKYDAILMEYGGPYIKYRLSHDKKHLNSAAQPILNTIRYNFPMLTSEALFTDRVYISRTDGGMNPTPQMLGMLTGGLRTSSPYADVTWQDIPQGFTALVADASSKHLVVETFLFGDTEQTISFRLWQLGAGTYSVSVTQGEKEIHQQELTLKRRGQTVSLPIKPGQEVTITIQQ